VQAGNSLRARLCSPPPFAIAAGKKPTAAQRAGSRYEEKALSYCEGWARVSSYSPLSKQWIEYRDLSGRMKWAEIDFLALSDTDDNLLLVEIKQRHTRNAFAQLRRYEPLVRDLYPDRHICPIIVCRYFDPDEGVVPMLDILRPHPHPCAAVIWEPSPLLGFNG
jgi:hypothetical protein